MVPTKFFILLRFLSVKTCCFRGVVLLGMRVRGCVFSWREMLGHLARGAGLIGGRCSFSLPGGDRVSSLRGCLFSIQGVPVSPRRSLVSFTLGVSSEIGKYVFRRVCIYIYIHMWKVPNHKCVGATFRKKSCTVRTHTCPTTCVIDNTSQMCRLHFR